MAKIIRVQPDTCNCVMHIKFDELTQAESYVARGGSLRPEPSKVCAIHAALYGTDPLVAHPQVHAENRLKNQVVGEVLNRSSVSENDVFWSFDSNRDLVLSLPTVSQADRAVVLSDLRKFGQRVRVL